MKITMVILAVILIISSLVNIAFTVYKSIDKVEQITMIINAGMLSVLGIMFSIFLIRGYNKGNSVLKISIFTILIIIFSFNIVDNYELVNIPVQSTVKNFTNTNVSDIIKWGETNNIEIEQKFEYSDIVPIYNIISQSAETGTLIKDVKKITVIVSDGPDPNKTVILPTMYGWTVDELIEFVNTNFLINVSVDFVVSPETKNTIIEQDKKGEIKRSDVVNFVFSKGNTEDIVPVEVVDLTNKSLFEASIWLKMNSFKYTVEEEFDDNVEIGKVISQSIIPTEIIDPSTIEVVIKISKGKKVIVPNLKEMTVQEITNWVIINKLKLKYDDRYDDNIASGKIISVSVNENDVLKAGDTISIVVSKGQLKMEEFTELNDFKTWAEKYGIKYEEQKENSDEVEEGKIIRFSYEKGQIIPNDANVIVYVSKGKPVEIISFIGMTKNQIIIKCRELNLGYSFSYGGFSKTISYDTVINQSISTGTTVDKGTVVHFTLSKGPGVTVQNFIGKSRNEVEAICSNIGLSATFVNGTYGNNDAGTVVAQTLSGGSVVDRGTSIKFTVSLGRPQTFTVIIQESWVLTQSFEATKNTLASMFSKNYPGVNFEYVAVDSNIGAAGLIRQDSPVTNGTKVTQGNTYKVYITK